ncbi:MULTISPECIES: preprotein translocase subunit SecG [Leptospira]|uniref:Protein-export membrane protein SecG n=5 Tax=Leptospira borgpetersenii TaxID=174 RepID=M3HQ07_LEPBO|nr:MULTISPECIES: preprotein translocase subunit SecG [Leptospira]EMG00146.1 preprotein translocase, SecG subunit [Leptospira borgpetersenii str. 200701203]EMO09727.1 preprotein translocase, SecG subunit [Leptospira borgpetersenii str. Noumea 25]ALO25939.1 preprotein translocase, SecG subunit [Leptospira borgpetersenii serovar Ballum]ANH00716.1 Preprotein translocase, SecG subunit [Leptospira borgpetersenii str. 4E]AXX16164.1 preprotein translocase subunit SecG [Leptospira borgpetersenii serova
MLNGVILTLFVFVSLFLVLLVMIQTGKGGGLLGGGSSQSVFGSSTADVLTKATRVTAILFIILSLFLSFLFAKKEDRLMPETVPALITTPPEETKSETNTPTAPATPSSTPTTNP